MKTTEPSIEDGQHILSLWKRCTSKPMTSREIEFAILVAKEEREACAMVCESLFDMEDKSCDEAEKCAAAIRKRSNVAYT